MSAIQLFNTLTKSKEIFRPIKSGEVSMYNCGPTVYDFAHIGNLRSYIFADTLRRVLEFNNFNVCQIINITDVGHLIGDSDEGEDKMTKTLKREGLPLTLEAMKTVATKYFDAFTSDLKSLNIEMPEKFPLASEHIQDDIELVTKLMENGYAYKVSDGIYFDTIKFPGYGKLGGMNGQDAESRIGVNEEKKDQRDFVLWKFDSNIGWNSPWGKGFPGWHIECSAMSRKYLGQPFDIHTGGIDHIPVHHNNEIAQSEAAYGTELANVWMHNAFVTMNDSKMAKSAGGFITLNTLRQESISPIAYRYWLLTAHYRSPINFSFEAVRGAQNALVKLMSAISQYKDAGSPIEAYIERFRGYVGDDLDMPKAVSLAWELIRDPEIPDADKLATLLQFDRVFGLGLSNVPKVNDSEPIPDEIIALLEVREQARKEKDWKKSDALRAEIESRGYEIKDNENGFQVTRKG